MIFFFKEWSDYFIAAKICLHIYGLSSHETPFVGVPTQIFSSVVLLIWQYCLAKSQNHLDCSKLQPLPEEGWRQRTKCLFDLTSSREFLGVNRL